MLTSGLHTYVHICDHINTHIYKNTYIYIHAHMHKYIQNLRKKGSQVDIIFLYLFNQIPLTGKKITVSFKLFHKNT